MRKIFSSETWVDLQPDLLRALALGLIAALYWCAVYDRWTLASWQTPITYRDDWFKSDVLSLFAAVKAAGDGHILPLFFNNIPELGAPHAANWDDYPLPEKPLLIVTGIMARFIGIFAAASVALMLVQILAAISFYAAARMLGANWLWSFAGALIFAFARFEFAQALHHLTVTTCWHLPLCVAVTVWVMREEGIRFRTWEFRVALFVAVITGIQNAYYSSMFGQFRCWRHGWRAALPPLAILGTALAAFVFINSNTLAHDLIDGPNSKPFHREYSALEVYGLKPVDLVVPQPDHNFPWFSAFGAAYINETSLSDGETPPSAYLGLLGLAALAWLIVESWRRGAGRASLPVEAWLILWIILFAGVGGVNCILGTCGFLFFRSTTRYSLVILCIALMFAVRQLSLIKIRKLRYHLLAYAAALLAVGLALWDQSPKWLVADQLNDIDKEVASDRAFAEKMEQQLPPQAMVFQYPIMDFPEGPTGGVNPYDHFRPYLYSQHLRFSFGTDKGRPQDQWERDLIPLSMPDAVAKLESFGFSALYVNLEGYPDGGADLIKSLKGMGRNDMFYSDHHDLLCIFLKPSAKPVRPDAY
jgi:phosphoglycerol transferase